MYTIINMYKSFRPREELISICLRMYFVDKKTFGEQTYAVAVSISCQTKYIEKQTFKETIQNPFFDKLSSSIHSFKFSHMSIGSILECNLLTCNDDFLLRTYPFLLPTL